MKIFISYRREDSADVAGRLYDHLEKSYGNDVFMDVDTIPLGIDFREHLNEAVSKCAVLLAIIGERWCGYAENGQCRIKDPNDFVRIEIESALARGIPVIPVLVGSGKMPTEQELPDSLKSLAFRNAGELRSGRYFRQQLDYLLRTLERLEMSTAVVVPQQSLRELEVRPPPASTLVSDIKSETLQVNCPHCLSHLRPDPLNIGRQMTCPFCGYDFLVGDASKQCSECGSARLPGAAVCEDCGFAYEA